MHFYYKRWKGIIDFGSRIKRDGQTFVNTMQFSVHATYSKEKLERFAHIVFLVFLQNSFYCEYLVDYGFAYLKFSSTFAYYLPCNVSCSPLLSGVQDIHIVRLCFGTIIITHNTVHVISPQQGDKHKMNTNIQAK